MKNPSPNEIHQSSKSNIHNYPKDEIDDAIGDAKLDDADFPLVPVAPVLVVILKDINLTKH